MCGNLSGYMCPTRRKARGSRDLAQMIEQLSDWRTISATYWTSWADQPAKSASCADCGTTDFLVVTQLHFSNLTVGYPPITSMSTAGKLANCHATTHVPSRETGPTSITQIRHPLPISHHPPTIALNMVSPMIRIGWPAACISSALRCLLLLECPPNTVRS